ncbi:MAG: ATP-dependent sacrificial sulfur transferase LarE [Oscillibacter sp.]|nr:ATP-dependent sacrificial sulfur transferase LarE [Oscillibacter sp.]
MLLQDFFRENPVCAVAFSGGVDSAYLLYAASVYGQRTAAYFVKTPFQPGFELEDAQDVVRRLGIPLTVLEFDVLRIPSVAANPQDRCYYCKRALFALLLEAASAEGFPLVLDGCNASDDASDRPGMRALRELGIRSPLRECGIAKSDIRRLAREAGLPVWDKPSYACLATRIPTGTAITQPDLTRIAHGESLLASLGFSDFRLRLRGGNALLQVRAEQIPLARQLLPEIQTALAADFQEIVLDDTPRITRET